MSHLAQLLYEYHDEQDISNISLPVRLTTQKTIYLNYPSFSDELKQVLNETNDFTVFSDNVLAELKKMLADINEPAYERIKNNQVKIRISNYGYDLKSDKFENMSRISEIDESYFNRLVLIRGTVTASSTNKIKMKKTRFRCIGCGVEIDFDFNNGSAVNLDKCFSCQRENNYELTYQQTVTTNSQTLTVEELSVDTDKNAATIDVLIDGDLVNKFDIGDSILVNGNIKFDVYNDYVMAMFKRKVSTNSYYNNMLAPLGGSNNGVDFDYFLEANNVQKLTERSIKFHDLSDEEKNQIDTLRKNPRLIEILVRSFAPHIYGHEIEKEVLLYQLIGGLGRSLTPSINNRGEIHVLLFGNPSTGKTDLMLFALDLAPKSRYGVGKGVSRPGLTGGVDNSNNKNVLVAGDAVMANRGLLVLDEGNEISVDALNALKEIMEKQTATVTKIKHGSFKTMTSVLMSTNPKGSTRYNRFKNFNENLGLDAALITRFDYISLFLDSPNPETAEKIAWNMVKTYRPPANDPSDPSYKLSKELLAKYIYLAKNSGNIPYMTPEAEKRTVDLFVKYKTMDYNEVVSNTMTEEDDDGVDRVSFSTRQLSSIFRLATARAMLLFKDRTDVNDVDAAEIIINDMLRKIGIDVETGKVDIGILGGGKSANKVNKENQFFDLLEKLGAANENNVPKALFINELRKQSKWKEVTMPKIEAEIAGYEYRNHISVRDDIISLNYDSHNNR